MSTIRHTKKSLRSYTVIHNIGNKLLYIYSILIQYTKLPEKMYGRNKTVTCNTDIWNSTSNTLYNFYSFPDTRVGCDCLLKAR